MTLAKKLNLKEGMAIRIVGTPASVSLGDVTTTTKKDGAVLVFAKTAKELDDHAALVVEASKADRLAWVAYPKAGQLGTDLNRDWLVAQLEGRGVQPVRQVALDDVWSALRFRSASLAK